MEPPTNRAGYYIWFVAVGLVFSAGLLINPPISPQEEKWRCVKGVELGGPFRLVMICDSWLFMDLAHDPARLLQPRNLRQSHPGIVLAAAVPAALFSIPFGRNRFTSYAAYMVVHATIMLACLATFLAIVRPPGGHAAPMVVAASLLLLFNTVAHDFLLSPITCLLHLLSPLFCLAIARAAWTRGLFESGRVFGLAFLAGLGLTAYGSLVLFLPAVLLPAGLRAWRQGASPYSFLTRAAAIVAIVLGPTIAWYALVLVRNGTVYNPELEIYRNWIWMLDDYERRGTIAVLTKLAALASVYGRDFIKFGAPPVILALGVLAVARSPRRPILRVLLPEVAPALFVSLLFAAFFITSNYIPPRTVYSATVPLVVLAGSLAAQAERSSGAGRRRHLRWLLLGATLAFGFYPALRNVHTALLAGPGAW